MASRDHTANVAQPAPAPGVRRLLVVVYRLTRFPAIGFTVLVGVLGVASAAPFSGRMPVLGMVVVSITFHVFAYVLNDLIDLPLDRTEPLRKGYPLVDGTVSTGAAAFLAVVQVPGAFGATLALGGGPSAVGALSTAFVLMAAYDLWGKRMSFPPLADALQGAAWCALALCGAYIAGSPTPMTAALAGFIFIYILMINGLHGPLRDLENDHDAGARTTAIFLGARPMSGDGIFLPRAVRIYAVILQLLLTAIVIVPPILGWLPAGSASTLFIVGCSLLVSVGCFVLLIKVGRLNKDRRATYLAGMLHLLLSLGLVVLLFLLHVGAEAKLVIAAAYVLPVLVMWIHNRRRWAETSTFLRGARE